MKKKIILGLLCSVLILSITTGCGDEKTNNDNNNNNVPSNVDLTIDESLPKTINCKVTEEYIKGNVYSTEIVVPNWNRYTFLKEYTRGDMDFDFECDNDTLEKTRVWTEDFQIYLDYSIDTYSVNMYSNQKERMTDSLLYKNVGKPTVYGNENGYWYAYMSKESPSYRENDPNWLKVSIFKDLDLMGKYNLKYQLEIRIDILYKNDVGKARLDYILNDIKQMYKEKHNIDLTELSVDMIKK